ncbi:MAG: NADH-quinone oxidoreductase subunit NuoK [Pseudomonadota bacterium]
MSWSNIGLHHYLIISAVLLTIGLFTVATRRNVVAILMGVELMLNAASLNFVAFSHYVHGSVAGQVFSVFIIILAAAEAAIALAIVLAIFRHFRVIDVEETATLRE